MTEANDTRLRIIVADDSAGMRQLVTHILQALGYGDVIAVENGAEALFRLQREQVDLLITDMQMPIVDGVELVQQVRPAFPELPILMISAQQAAADVRGAVRAGVDAYLAKPFTPQQLQEKIEGLLDRDLRHRIERIVNDAGRYAVDQDSPLVVFGEVASSAEALMAHGGAAQFLWHGISAIERINASDPEIALGYELESENAVIGGHLRQLGHRVKVLVLAADVENSCTLVRLTKINNEDLTIVFVCDALADLVEDERRALQDLGVFVVERDELPRDSFERLLREFAVARAYMPSRQVVPPRDEIRRRVEADIDNLVSLPVLPEVYLEIGKLDMDPESEIREWAAVIDRDPLAGAMVVRRARSPVYGFSEPIENTRHAVTLLGKRTIKDLVASQAVKQAFRQVTGMGFSVEDYWVHSLAVALMCRILATFADKGRQGGEGEQEFNALALSAEAVAVLEALHLDRRLRINPRDDVFGAGLMHDIGKVAMAVSYPGIFPEIVVELEAESWRVPMLNAEGAVAGSVDHMVVGRLLAERWQQSRAIVDAVGQHHDPSDNDGLAMLVSLADFCAGAVYPFPSEAVYPPVEIIRDGVEPDAGLCSDAAAFIAENVPKRIGVDIEDLLQLGQVLAPEVRRLTEEWQQLV